MFGRRFSAAHHGETGDLFSTPLFQIQTGVLVKSFHLWLSAAVIAFSSFPGARAVDLYSGAHLRRGAAVLHEHTSDRPRVRLRWFRPVKDVATVFRAQSDDEIPTPPEATDSPRTLDLPSGTSSGVTGDPGIELPEPSTWNAFSPPITSDPFLDGGITPPYAPQVPAYPPSGGPFRGPAGVGGYSIPGTNGGQPYRFGWEQRFDMHLIPGADVSGGGAAGEFEEFGVDYDLTLTRPFIPGWILKETGQFRARTWQGPASAGPPAVPPPPAGLPGSGFRLGIDFEFSTPQVGPYSMTLAVTPSLNTDFNRSPTSKAFQLDGRGIIWWGVTPGWSFGLGAMFWDRVDDRVLPYAGWVYRDDYWEWRLMFPESEIRLFLGNEPWWSKWLYVRAKYNIDAYEGVGSLGVQREVEFEDWQLTLGFQMDAGYYRWFIEGGLILDRELEYDTAPDISVDPSYITRIGIRY
jgi:hypothetical protein